MTAQKIPILFVIENECFGGGERAFAQLINGLDRDRFKVYAACLTERLNPSSAAFTGEISGAAGILSLDLRRRVSLSAFFSLKKFIRENNIRIIHSQGARADFYARQAARAAGNAAIVSTIASPVEEYNVSPVKKAVYRALDRFGGSSVDRFVAVADHIKRKLVSGCGISPEKVVRIYNGVDAAAYAPGPESVEKTRFIHNIAPGCFLAAAFCRLSWEKGLFDLVDAAGRISAAVGAAAGGIKYVIAGEGPLEKELRSAVASRGLTDSFVFTGFLKDVGPLLSACDVFVLPSYREGFPVSILEAMAAGRPVIASDIDGVNESVAEGVSGLLVPAGDAAALASALEALLKNRDKAVEMGRRGREIVAEKFNLGRMIKAHEDLYRGL
jgi:glycosyltransferase involved in cell wall biosynthesis